jgi:hypothetical protein
MDVNEPRPRRRGFFHHSETGEPDTGEHENPEGFIVRVTRAAAHGTLAGSRFSGGRQSRSETPATVIENGRLRSASATGSRQRAHLTR